MGKRLSWALKTMMLLENDDEVLTYRVYRGNRCIDEFTGTRGQWFDHIINSLSEPKNPSVH